MSQPQPMKRKKFGPVVTVLLVVWAIPLTIAVLTFLLLAGLFLHLAAWCCWCVRGRYVLFVYSDSPIWHDYIEERILPRLSKRVVILNWSDRSRWQPTLGVLAFRYFGGDREFNPMAIVFRPLRLARKFRFYEPFCEFKHGKTEAVAKMESELYGLVDEITGSRTAS
ncbi:MAG: hypothetical protein HZA91_09230 [Verrucomicrobia bacterium]|nr:hypothetical protein [Verrucomicrobiota bacterium]